MGVPGLTRGARWDRVRIGAPARRCAAIVTGLLLSTTVVSGIVASHPGTAAAATAAGAGSLDPQFGSAGTVLSGSSDGATGVAVVPTPAPPAAPLADSGNVVVSGSSGAPSEFQVGMFTGPGAVDTAFGVNGSVAAFTGGALAVTTVPSTGNVIAAGYTNSSLVSCGGAAAPVPVVAEYTPTGSPVFTSDLRAATTRSVSLTLNSGSTTVVLDKGTLFGPADVGAAICGTGIPSGATITFVSNSTTALISVPATLTTTSTNPAAATVSQVASGQFNAVTLDAKGNIVIAGQTVTFSGTPEGLVARLSPSGALDTSFDVTGYVKTFALAGNSQAAFNSVAVVPKGPADAGDIMAGGYSDAGGNQYLTILALTATGPDTNFGTSGAVQSPTNGSVANGVTALANGNVVAVGSDVSGQANSAFLLAQFQPDGTPDASFGSGGQVVGQPATGNSDELDAVALSPGGSLLVAAGTSPDVGTGEAMVVAVYNVATGAVDSNFGTGGVAQRSFVGAPAAAAAVAVQADDKIVTAGQAPVVGGDEGIGVIRMFGPTLPGGLVPVTPARLLDTRNGTGGVTGPVMASQPPLSLSVLGVGGLPSSGMGAVVLNVTVTQPTAPGFITVYPDGVGVHPLPASTSSPARPSPTWSLPPWARTAKWTSSVSAGPPRSSRTCPAGSRPAPPRPAGSHRSHRLASWTPETAPAASPDR